jgi:hypothetical protein
MTSQGDSTGVVEHIIGRRGMYGNTGEPIISKRKTAEKG